MLDQLAAKFTKRQTMVSDDFELYYYSGQPQQPVEPHIHNCYEIYFFLEGKIRLVVDSAEYKIRPGDFAFIAPGTTHYPLFLHPASPYRRFVLWISPSYYHKLTMDGAATDILPNCPSMLFHTDATTFRRIQSDIFQLIEELRWKRFGWKEFSGVSLKSLLLYLNRYVYEQQHQKTSAAPSPLYLAVGDFISLHLSEELSLERIAHEFFVSKYYISHLFKENFGISIHQYLMKKRLAAIKEAIPCGEPITKLCVKYGFKDYSCFYRAFKKEYGMSPSEYLAELPKPESCGL